MIKAYETSPTNQACIDSSTDLIYGKGIEAKNQKALEDYLYSLTTDEEIRKICFDYKLFGNAAIQAVFNTERDRIIGFYHLPVVAEAHSGDTGSCTDPRSQMGSQRSAWAPWSKQSEWSAHQSM